MSKQLIMLIGNIGSGKSTYAKKLAKEGYIVISRDALRYMIGAGEYVFNHYYERVISQWTKELVEIAMENKVNIVLDECCMNKYIRWCYLHIAMEHKYKVKAIVMPYLTKKESVDRRLKSNHGNGNRVLWNSVWSQFNKVYIKPSMKEGFSKIVYVK